MVMPTGKSEKIRKSLWMESQRTRVTLNQRRIGVVFSAPMCLKPLSWFPVTNLQIAVVAPPQSPHLCWRCSTQLSTAIEQSASLEFPPRLHPDSHSMTSLYWPVYAAPSPIIPTDLPSCVPRPLCSISPQSSLSHSIISVIWASSVFVCPLTLLTRSRWTYCSSSPPLPISSPLSNVFRAPVRRRQQREIDIYNINKLLYCLD